MRKQMEGDNQRRRALARQARERGEQPSRDRTTLGASKQPTHLDAGKRAGPPPAGGHKQAGGGQRQAGARGGPNPARRPPAGPAQARPAPVGPTVTGTGYRELVGAIGRRAGVDFREAKVAAEATVLVLSRALESDDRERLLAAVPVSLHDVTPIDGIERHRDLAGFLAEVARISGRTPEQARYQAAATLATLAEWDGDLIASLRVPEGLRELVPG